MIETHTDVSEPNVLGQPEDVLEMRGRELVLGYIEA